MSQDTGKLLLLFATLLAILLSVVILMSENTLLANYPIAFPVFGMAGLVLATLGIHYITREKNPKTNKQEMIAGDGFVNNTNLYSMQFL